MRAYAHARARTTGRYANGKIFSQIPDGISIPKMYVLYNPQKTPVYDIVGWTIISILSQVLGMAALNRLGQKSFDCSLNDTFLKFGMVLG